MKRATRQEYLSKALLGSAIAIFLCLPGRVGAEHPHDVIVREADQRHFEALTLFRELPERQRGVDTYLAAARSAWALSLPEVASALFMTASQRVDADDHQLQGRVRLSLATIAVQEGKYADAERIANDTLEMAGDTPSLRGGSRFVLGASAFFRSRFGDAITFLEKALPELTADKKDEARLLLGRSYMRMGDYASQVAHLEEISLDSAWAPDAIRFLAASAQANKDLAKAETWLEKGRSTFPDRFYDSWVDYVLMQSVLNNASADEVVAKIQDLERKYPASDPWVGILQAGMEARLFIDSAAVGQTYERSEVVGAVLGKQ